MFIQIKKKNRHFTEGLNIKGSFEIAYKTNHLNYEFENDRFFFLLDTIIDKSKSKAIYDHLNNLKKVSPQTVGDLFNECYFLLVIDKTADIVHVLRDPTGIKTGYYSFNKGELMIGTLVHDLAKSKEKVQFSKEAIYQLLYANYILDGTTYYEGIHELPIGTHHQYDLNLKLVQSKKRTIYFQKENKLSPKENINTLRQETQKIHQKFLAPKNTVLLSGGLDSIAMLIALDDNPDTKELNNISFKVKDTIQDETGYAINAAEQLNRPITIKEINVNNSNYFKDFEQRFMKMNNPYYGIWIFGNLEGHSKEMYYAGQDTRLHTPALNEVDKIAFSFLNIQDGFLMRKILKPLLNLGKIGFKTLKWEESNHKIIRNIWKLLHVADLKEYINKFHFKLDKNKVTKMGLSTKYFEAYQKHFDFDLTQIISKRALYNKIVEKKWLEQYQFDIRYMQDLARLNNTYVAMPFYHPQLASFSSSIPFALATKRMIGRARFGQSKAIIYKYVLRHAFRDKLSDTCFFRAKAVSQTFFQLNNGIMGQKMKAIIHRDLQQEESFIKNFQLEQYVKRYMTTASWGRSTDEYLGTIYYIVALCIYQYQIISKQEKVVKSPTDHREKVMI